MPPQSLHSAYSSRSASPERRPLPYDPFDNNAYPIELTHISQPRPRGYSFDNGPRQGLYPGVHFTTSQAGGQYAPVSGRPESPQRSLRSGRESMFSTTSLYQNKIMDADTQALVDRRSGELAQWHVYWVTPALMISLFVLGVIVAVGHHIFYKSLDGQLATEQLKMVRYGTAMAFFVKSTLVGAVVVCYRQRIWHTLRRKAMTINGIDGLFSATEDPTTFFMNWEMIRNGKLATLMAVCSWLIPIASVLSPASLTSEVRSSANLTTCGVATLNFTRESIYDFRIEEQTRISGKSLNYYNTTDRTGQKDYFFDYFDQPSKNARRLAFGSAYQKQPQERKEASKTFCGQGWNCTYTISFVAPGYKCDDVSDSQDTDAPFTIDSLAPKGNFIYNAVVDQNDYANPQIDTTDGVPTKPPPYPETLGVFESEPILWIGYSDRTTTRYEADSPYAKQWEFVHEPKMFKCVMHYTNYTFEMNYRPSQTAVLKQRDFIRPVMDTTLEPNPVNTSDYTATPSSKFISPRNDVPAYKLTATYHSMGVLLRNFLRGNIEKSSDLFIITRSDISETRLMDGRTAYPLENLMGAVQSLFEDMILTLLSEPDLVAAANETVPCEKFRTAVVYAYLPQSLWLGYALAVSITFASIVIGFYAIYQNGVASDTLFSRILVTTRNPTLDHLSVGACLGGDPFPKELKKTKLRFGVLLDNEPREGPLGKIEHCCFGTAGETKDIVKYNNYAGLRNTKPTSRYEGGDEAEKQGLLSEA